MTILACVLALACPAHGGHALPPPPPPRGGHAIPESNRDVGRRLAAEERGWDGPEWDCLNVLWTRESGWQMVDPNPASDADGIPQANPASKMGPGWQWHRVQQIRWGLGYITARYGTPCAALAHSNASGFY